MHSPGIDPTQQEMYDYIESLEMKETTTKETIQSPGEGRNLVKEESASNILKQDIFELETPNLYLKNENQALKTQSEIQIAKSGNMILHLSLWYKKNKKLKKENKIMQREIIN